MAPPLKLTPPDPPQRTPYGHGTPPGRPGARGPYRFGPLWWVILIVLAVWNLWATVSPREPAAATLPYSQLFDQLKAGNVLQVRIAGETLSGLLTGPILWPQTAPSNKNGTPSIDTPGSTPGPARPAVPVTPPANAGQAAPPGPTPSEQRLLAAEEQPQNYSHFTTTFPSVVGDPSLMPLMQQHHVVINVAPGSTPWLALLLSYGVPLLLMISVLVWMGQQASKTQSGIFGFARTRARRYGVDRPNVTSRTSPAWMRPSRNSEKSLIS